jgi:flagellar basal-body rod modification protein FlgD
MIGVKGGTKTWSDAPQRTDFKADNTNAVSAADKEKFFGGEDIGDTLNKVADPNWVDESKKMRTAGNNQLGKDAFMTLLLTQMKNQDPTNPLKSHEMAAQLAQFTSLEKLHNINEGIEGLRKDSQPNTNFQALEFIGKAVTTDNSKISRSDVDARHDVRFTLPSDAQKFTMQIKDANGAVIRTLETKGVKAGKQEMNWNGMTDEGAPAPIGDYSVTFEAVASNGRKLHVETKTEGVISGVNFTPKGPQLMVGKQVISMADVKQISDPGIQQPNMGTLNAPTNAQLPPDMAAMAAQFAQANGMSLDAPNANQSPKKAEVKPPTQTNTAKRARLSQGTLEGAAMEQGLINKLNKEGAKAGGMNE